VEARKDWTKLEKDGGGRNFQNERKTGRSIIIGTSPLMGADRRESRKKSIRREERKP